jgi:hypothetical protein
VTACSAGSKALGIEAGVERVDARNNQVTVKTHDDRTASYDPGYCRASGCIAKRSAPLPPATVCK